MILWTAIGFELVGVGFLIIGVVRAIALFVYTVLTTTGGWPAAIRCCRVTLGRSTLLGLEFLVAADIIGTVGVTPPSLLNVAGLGLVVLTRTFFSLSVQVESEGQWPWQRTRKSDTRSAAPKARERL